MKILAILGALQGLVLLLFFLTIKKNQAANINMLMGILLSIGQMLLCLYVENPFEASGNLSLKLLTRILVFPIPVFFYFYFRFLVTGAKTYRKWDIIHILPTLIAALFVCYPYFHFNNPKPILTNQQPLAFAKEGFYFMFFQSAVIIFYAKLSFYSIFKLDLTVFELYTNLLEKEKKWLTGAILGIFMTGLTGILATIFGLKELLNPNFNLGNLTNYVYLVFGVVSFAFYWMSYQAIRQPEIFRNFDDLFDKKEKYQHSGLTEALAPQLATKLVDLMVVEKLYLQPNLKLADLAAQLDTSNKLLSQLMNQHFGQNFYDFVNSYRLETAKAKLVNPEMAHLSIQGIALEAGFKSKSTFYNFFKKQTGMTPTEFQKRQR